MQKDTPDVAEEIRRYCAANPQARDTLEGITWWVQVQVQGDIRNNVADAVQSLVKEGKLEKHLLKDGSVVYGCQLQQARE